jgi:type IV secretion system protein VirD4
MQGAQAAQLFKETSGIGFSGLSDVPESKWRGFAGKATKWGKEAAEKAKEAAEKAKELSIEATKAADKFVREEIDARKSRLAEHDEKLRKEEAAKAAREAQEAAEKARVAKEQAEIKRREIIARDPAIRIFYDNKLNVVTWKTGSHRNWVTIGEKNFDTFKYDFILLSRPISSMNRGEIEICRYTDLFANVGLFDSSTHTNIKFPLVYNSGNCEREISNLFYTADFSKENSIHNKFDAIHFHVTRWGLATKEPAVALFLSKFAQLEADYPNDALVKEFRSKILSGSKWLDDRTAEQGNFSFTPTATSLLIGETESRKRLYYTGEGSLVSIAPAGSGKTQCHVFPNLLSYVGPAIVLDVKGSCLQNTGKWRANNVGPIYAFNPLDPGKSAKYNPLSLLVNDSDLLWEDAKILAELLIIPEDKNDPSWENRGRDVLTGIITWLVTHKPPENRQMGAIIDVVSKIGWDTFIEDAKYTVEIPPLVRLGNALAVMPEKQLEGVLDAVRRHLSVWEGSRVERVTSASSWTPDVLRDGSKSTIYICIPPNEIETYAPLLRVIFAQHIRYLMRRMPPRGQAPILFMLDELPRLGPMKPVEEALEVGREYGLRLWMFAQSLGQFEKSYANAEGMLSNCFVRIYMNPSAHDGTAKRISDELGYTESILDGTRLPMVEPTQLTGPEYKDWQIVFSRNSHPAKLRKLFAYQDKKMSEKMRG